MTLLSKIRKAIADRNARLARDEHLAAIKSRIHQRKAAHQCTKSLYDLAREYTHGALRRG
jgi:hypothetical protein